MFEYRVMLLAYSFTWRLLILMFAFVFVYVSVIEYLKIIIGQGATFQFIYGVLGFLFLWSLNYLALRWVIRKGIIKSD